jgi:hypothetical protein
MSQSGNLGSYKKPDDCYECGNRCAVSASAHFTDSPLDCGLLGRRTIMVIPLEIVLALAAASILFALLVAVAAA